MSHWNMNDEATQDFMIRFYENWQAKHITKYEAFQITQKEMKTKYVNPIYWAGFVLIER